VNRTVRRACLATGVWLWCTAAIVGVFVPEAVSMVIYMVLTISFLAPTVAVLIGVTVAWVLDDDEDRGMDPHPRGGDTT